MGLYLAGAAAVGTNAFHPVYAATFVGGAVAAVVVGGVALGVFATLTTFAARRLSQYREFAADRGATALTGDPAALADALADLDPEAPAPPETGKRHACREVQGLCLLPHGFVPGTGPDGDATAGPVFDGDAFRVSTRTHTPTDERVARLRGFVEE